ncbi:hypothetical protein BCR33DRAFT_848767 [Rhizoclosmatium globosum]|uniref:Ankyrin repeat domain-containing protein n=1 Tax=Rhizoclosmatium globosum TaxID=329046 RepID=A0A1Y2CK93_9FUNG|nr:hypothetical protein BCR33DRAFT_848767 [Rhizoclosmatium globosum]|eukprot:ORY47433.1 hypothetical protein BCR33DRAFT_848767 [Rhizoclosmatium globosum]
MEEAFSLIISNSATTLKTHISTAKPSTFTTQIRGHSLLSLAIALNHKECIKVLLDHPLVSSTLRTKDGWSPLQEAASVGDRDVVAMVLVHWRREMVGWWETRGSLLVEALHELSLPDFSMTLNWRFTTWLPFIQPLCPSDTITIRKHGRNVRIDSTLVGFESLSWVRGNVSILCVDDGKRVVLVDHDRRVVQQVVPRVKEGEDVLTEEELQEEVNILLNTPLVSPPHVDISKAKVRKVQDGVLFKTDRVETVNGFDASVWVIEGISVETRTREEHLHVPPYPTHQHQSDTWATSTDTSNTNPLETSKQYRPSLTPPEPHTFTPSQFHTPSLHPTLQIGRPRLLKTTTRQIQATLWMHDPTPPPPPPPPSSSLFSWISSSPPPPPPTLQITNKTPQITLTSLVPLLTCLNLFGDVQSTRIRDFLGTRMPPGVPVQVEVPVIGAGGVSVNVVVSVGEVKVFEGGEGEGVVEEGGFEVPGRRRGYVKGDVFGGGAGVK